MAVPGSIPPQQNFARVKADNQPTRQSLLAEITLHDNRPDPGSFWCEKGCTLLHDIAQPQSRSISTL